MWFLVSGMRKGELCGSFGPHGILPEGGGQYADSGKINGMEVVDVKEKNDVIFHYMKQSIEPGTEVKGEIDFEERFSKMQQHTGEHIVPVWFTVISVMTTSDFILERTRDDGFQWHARCRGSSQGRA